MYSSPAKLRRSKVRKRGFSLVELAVVIVIVGVIMAAVLAAQSIIASAKITDFIKQMQQTDIAVQNFATMYDSLPGDSKRFDPKGNNNRRIEDDAMLMYPGIAPFGFTKEIANFWVHLGKSGFGEGKYNFVTTSANNLFDNIPPDLNIPPVPSLSDKAGILVSYDNGTTRNYYFITDYSQNNLSYDGLDGGLDWGVVSPARTFAIDKKIDDGLAKKGKFRSGTSSGLFTAGHIDNNCTMSPVSDLYNLNFKGPSCKIYMEMFSQVGRK